jgi:hypothetical protein
MNPETLRTWFRPVEVNSHRAEGVASPRPLRRLSDQESITAGWVTGKTPAGVHDIGRVRRRT